MKNVSGRGATRLFGVVGKPILHSKSPQLHAAGFAAFGMDAAYVRMAVDSAAEALETASQAEFSGLNFTAPFKEEAAVLVRLGDEASRCSGAVNTVIRSNGGWLGYNTDTNGLAQALLSNGVPISGEKALVLGAGGAARAAVSALTECGAMVIVANRTLERAYSLAEKFDAAACSLSPQDLRAALPECRIIVGCASTSERLFPPDLLSPPVAVLDANYPATSALVADAQAAGCRVIDGKEWLLHQGAKAFELFSERAAPEPAMRRAVFAEADDGLEGGHIALVGFMGSGKSTVASMLGRMTGLPVLDTDEVIEDRTGTSIRNLFERQGEEMFRSLEEEEIGRLMAREPSVVSVGGGAVLKAANRAKLKTHSLVVWLWASVPEVLKRIPRDGTRPVFEAAHREGLLAELLAGRLMHYAAVSDLMVPTEGKGPDQIARRIMDEIREAFPGFGTGQSPRVKKSRAESRSGRLAG